MYHELEKALLERQVLGDELDRAGYIAPEELNAMTIFDQVPSLNVSSNSSLNKVNCSTSKNLVSTKFLGEKLTTCDMQLHDLDTKPKMTKVLPSSKSCSLDPLAGGSVVISANLQQEHAMPEKYGKRGQAS